MKRLPGGAATRVESLRRSCGEQDSFEQLLFRARVVAAFGVGALIVGLGLAGAMANWPFWVAYWFVHRLGFDAVARDLWRRHRRRWPFNAYVDAFDIALFATVVPAARPYLGITIVGVLPIVLICSGIRVAIGSSLVAILGMLVGTVMTGHGVDGPLLVALAAHLSTMPLAVHRLLKERERTSRQFEELVDGLEAVVWQGDPRTGRVDFVSPRIFSLFGRTTESFLADPWDWIVADDADEYGRQRSEIQPSEAITCTYRVIDGSGNVRWVRDTIRLSQEDTGLMLRGVIVDVTTQKLAELQVEHQATRDGLTGTLNRNAFLAEVDRSLTNASVLALVMLDLDNFKEINDSLGHAAGDQLLRTVSDRLTQSVGESGYVGRIGGDEFAVVLRLERPDMADAAVAQLSLCLASPIISEHLTVQASASFGYAVSPEDGSSSERLLMMADQAMYKAKRSGSVVTRAGATSTESVKVDESESGRGELLRDLPKAVLNGEFDIRLLPKIDAVSGRVTGAEALVRWNHPARGLLQPARFVDLAESSGSIRALTDEVLRLAISQLVAWRNEGLNWTISVNLCVRNLLDPSLPALVRELLHTHSLDPSRLIIEISEDALSRDRGIALKVLGTLRDLGCAISIDDFGSGASSLVDLDWLRPYEVKVDRPFVDGLGYRGADRAVVAGAVALAGAMRIRVVAEGVQTAEQLIALRELGIDEYQGYFASEPMMTEEFPRWARAWDESEHVGNYAPSRTSVPFSFTV
jgi:diguanylate cyclase (GGDEF)-like protein